MKCLAVLSALWLSMVPTLVAPTLAAPLAPAPQTAPAGAIQPGDTLEIQVAGEPALSKSYTVDSAGSISLDMVGRLAVAQRTPEQVAGELRARLERFLKQPTVSVLLSTPLRQELLLSGEVLRPGAVKVRSGDRLLDALAAVGGLGPAADGSRATLVRRGAAQPQAINLDLLLKGDLSQNILVNDGDIIQVPKREPAHYQILGEVKTPGSRSMEGPISVLDAIVAAGGLSERADRSRVTLTRKGQPQPLSLDLDLVLAGDSSANLMIQPGDIVSVGARMVVQVAGEVRAPGERLLRNGGTLMEAILFAGGFTPEADRAAIQITHRDGTVETASLADVTTVVGGPVLRPADLVIIPRGQPAVISIVGAVRNPGPLRYQHGMKITDALMAGGGLLENANWKEIRVLRGEDKARKIIVFNLEAYLKAPQTANVTLEAGDQLFIQAQRQKNGKSVLRRLMEVMPLAGFFF